METFRIRPMHVGMATNVDQSMLLMGIGFGNKLKIPCVSWLIEGAKGEKIVVDTGPFGGDSPSARFHLHGIERPDEQRIDNALRELGVDAKEVQTVIYTHLHYDHCHNAGFLPNATFYVHSLELAYALDPIEWHNGAFDAKLPGVNPPWFEIQDRLRTLEGDVELLPGLKTVHLPGHTPGSLGVAVKTTKGICLIAGDTVPLMANWEGNALQRHIPGVVATVNFADLYHSMQKIETLADVVIPSHDFRALEMSF